MARADGSYLVVIKKAAVPGTQLLDGHRVLLNLSDPLPSLGVQARCCRGEYSKDIWTGCHAKPRLHQTARSCETVILTRDTRYVHNCLQFEVR